MAKESLQNNSIHDSCRNANLTLVPRVTLRRTDLGA